MEPESLSISLPDDVWMNIFSFNPNKDCLRLALVCRSFVPLVYNSITFLEGATLGMPLLKLKNLTGISISCSAHMDETVGLLTNLTYLDISFSYSLSDKGLSTLTNLTYLDMSSVKTAITDSSLSLLTNLTYLNSSGYFNDRASEHSISQLVNLNTLIIESGIGLTYSTLSLLTGLTCLKLGHNVRLLNNHAFYGLTKLKQLYIVGCYNLSDDGLSRLTLLEELSIDTEFVGNGSIGLLTNLTNLIAGDINFNSEALLKLTNLTSFTNTIGLVRDEFLESLAILPKLTSLTLNNNPDITDHHISLFTNLTSANLDCCSNLTNVGVSNLINLKFLSTRGTNIQKMDNMDFLII